MAEWIHTVVKNIDIDCITCSNCGCGAPLYSYIKEGETEEKIQHMETVYCPNCGEKIGEEKNLDYKKLWEDTKRRLLDKLVCEYSADLNKFILELMESLETLDKYELTDQKVYCILDKEDLTIEEVLKQARYLLYAAQCTKGVTTDILQDIGCIVDKLREIVY